MHDSVNHDHVIDALTPMAASGESTVSTNGHLKTSPSASDDDNVDMVEAAGASSGHTQPASAFNGDGGSGSNADSNGDGEVVKGAPQAVAVSSAQLSSGKKRQKQR